MISRIFRTIFYGRPNKYWKPEFDRLAQYNSEVARGIVHTKEYQEKMKEIQEDYDREVLREYYDRGYI